MGIGLGRYKIGGTHSEKGREQRSAKIQIDIILDNSKDLLKVRNGRNLLQKIHSMNEQDFPFTRNQLAEIIRIYEKTFEGAGYEHWEELRRR